MKNIFLLPMDKPSRLWVNNLLQGKLELSKEALPYNTTQNIYITNNEEIKEGDWVLGNFPDNPIGKVISKYGEEFTAQSLNGDKYGLAQYDSNKIVLCTDIDLINDGVQAIDDDFLEWFVKNSSCESVEVSDYIKQIGWESDANGRDMILNKRFYEIFIPKEEQKQHIIEMMQNDEELGLYGANIIDTWLEENGDTEIEKQVEREAEELELQHYSEEYANCNTTDDEFSLLKNAFIAGAKRQKEQHKIDTDDAYSEGFENGKSWQAERSYSEEEVINILKKGLDNHYLKTNKNHLKIWFEQFKK